jgi:hypothetical protein
MVGAGVAKYATPCRQVCLRAWDELVSMAVSELLPIAFANGPLAACLWHYTCVLPRLLILSITNGTAYIA